MSRAVKDAELNRKFEWLASQSHNFVDEYPSLILKTLREMAWNGDSNSI